MVASTGYFCSLITLLSCRCEELLKGMDKFILIVVGFSRIESINEASGKLTSFRNTHQLQFNLEEHNRTSGRTEIWSNACFLEDVSEVLSELDDDYLGDSDDEDDLQDNMEIKDDDSEFQDSQSL